MTQPEPRPELSCIDDVPHGAIDPSELAQYGLAMDEVIDFSANVNPFAPLPAVQEAMMSVDPAAYPDREATQFREAAAAHHGIDTNQVVAGNGSVELLWLLAMAFIRAGDPVLIVGPTFGEYARVAAIMGGTVHTCNAQAEDSFRVPTEVVESSLKRISPRLLFLCNPNNPTGSLLDCDQIEAWARQFPDTLIVMDEAYQEYLAKPTSALEFVRAGLPNVVVLRSMTKGHGLAGIRLGYAVVPFAVASALRRVRPPWNVNTFAQRAGVTALGDRSDWRTTLQRLHAGKQQLCEGLRDLGLRPFASATPFFLVPVPDAAGLRRTLLARGLLVRDCASFGLAETIRLSPRAADENNRLLTAVGEALL